METLLDSISYMKSNVKISNEILEKIEEQNSMKNTNSIIN